MLHLLNQGEVAEVLDVSRSRVHRIVETHADFPTPYAYTLVGERQMKLWRAEDVTAWDATWERLPGRRMAV